jgi:hypothetical protein
MDISDKACVATTEVNSVKPSTAARPRKQKCGGEGGVTTEAVAVKRRKKMEWASIKERLGSRLMAQMEGGQKLTINSHCSNKCPGPDQNVFLYPDGMQRLLEHCSEINTALHHNQHFSLVLEVRTDICVNQIDFVVATAIGNRLMLIYVEFDMLGAIVTCAAINNGGNGAGINPLRTQTIGLSQGAFHKLEHFVRCHMNPEILPPPPPPPVTTEGESSMPPPKSVPLPDERETIPNKGNETVTEPAAPEEEEAEEEEEDDSRDYYPHSQVIDDFEEETYVGI